MRRALPNKSAIIALYFLIVACDTQVDNTIGHESASHQAVDEVLLRYCGGCHGLPKPASRTASEWPAIVWRMQTYRGQRAMPKLTETEVAEITEYLVNHAKDQ